jgi:hypothetical protein
MSMGEGQLKVKQVIKEDMQDYVRDNSTRNMLYKKLACPMTGGNCCLKFGTLLDGGNTASEIFGRHSTQGILPPKFSDVIRRREYCLRNFRTSFDAGNTVSEIFGRHSTQGILPSKFSDVTRRREYCLRNFRTSLDAGNTASEIFGRHSTQGILPQKFFDHSLEAVSLSELVVNKIIIVETMEGRGVIEEKIE